MSSQHELLTPVDAAWFRMESPEDPADIAAVMVLEGPLDAARLRAVLEERLLVHARFRRRIVDSVGGVSAPRWEDEADFSLDAHLKQVRLDGDGEDALAGFVSAYMNEPIDFTRSPWSARLVEGLGAGAALVVRIHHSMGDGFALLDLLVSLADDEAGDHGAAPRAPDPEHAPHGLLDTVRTATDLMSSLGHLLVIPFDPPTCFRGELDGERRIAWSPAIPLERVKAIARAHGATINDILMTCLAGAYRRYMIDRGTLPAPFRAIVPVNLRPPSEPIDHEHGNWFGLVFLDLPVDLESAEARLAALKRSMDTIKQTKEAVVALGILAVLGRTPHVVEHITAEIFSRKATVVATNVPGPRAPVVLAGSRISDMWFWAPHPCGLATGASILSYAGRVRVGIRSDAGVVPDPERIARLFSDELSAWETP